MPLGLRRALRSSNVSTWRMIVATAAFGLLALVAGVVMLHTEARRRAAEEAERSADIVAQSVAREQERLIEGAQQLLFGLSQRSEVRSGRPSECALLLEGVVKAYAGYLDLVAARPDGSVLCSARRATALPGAAQVQDVALAVQSGVPMVGRYGFDRASRRPALVVLVPAVDDAGVVRAVLVAALDVNHLARAAVETRLPPGASLLLLDQGVVLAHHPEPERWTGELLDESLRTNLGVGVSFGPGLDGAATFFVAQPLLRDTRRAGESLVVITLPRRAVYYDADRLLSLQLASLAVFALAATIAGGLLVDRLVRRPAYGVLRVVRSLGSGELRARMRRGDRRGTVGKIARSLRTLAERMEAQETAARRLQDELKRERAARLLETAPPASGVPVPARTLGVVPPIEPTLPVDVLVPTDGTYWGFREPPFQNVPNPRFLWLSPSHSDALVRLTYALQQRRGCALLTGEPGCGKTLLTHAVIQRLDAGRYDIALLTNPRGGRVELLREVLYELGVETAETSPGELLHLLHDLVVANHQRGRDTLLIVDDAQQAEDPGWFEELGGLLNLQTNEQTLVTILLVGTLEVAARVHAARHLDRRVSIRCELKPLDVEQTGLYIASRLSVAGGRESLFSAGAAAAIHRATGGVPSAINDLCDNALLWARLNGRRAIDESVIERVLGDTTRADVPRPV
ncbi:MAG TPA: AAA family ATPase [Methylomirabilota bacterium]|nr:AAA family ATPase [Methylomirabilota bacterium]